ncbi:MAG: hypothetical protein CV087_05635 [Candidatus Brocadia sp. WS118]|nr:MAG: hypothetical protein CV087_05635 [Candidatus Brocadia sp. WS118]
MSESDCGFVDFKTIKKSISMLQVLEHYGLAQTLKGNGDSLSGPCPLHGGQTKGQFKVSTSKNCWHCFGQCKSGGNVLDFVSLKENIGIREAAIYLMERIGLSTVPVSTIQSEGKEVTSPQRQKDDKEPVTTAEESKINKPLGFVLKYLDPDHPYLTDQGLSKETVLAFGLGYCKRGILAERIAIPIQNKGGELVAYIGRFPGTPPEGKEKYKFPEGFKKSLELFNGHRAIKESSTEPLVLVQSVFDGMRIWQAGYRRTVALMGNSLSEEQATLVKEIVSSQGRVVLLLREDVTTTANQSILLRLSSSCFTKLITFQDSITDPEILIQAIRS